jgi:hypothetical protein
MVSINVTPKDLALLREVLSAHLLDFRREEPTGDAGALGADT